MTYLKGSFKDYEKERKGYISGTFFPEDSPNYEERIEINFKQLPDDFSAPRHLHKIMKTWVIVTKGKMYFNIDDESVEVGAGEFLMFDAGTPEEVVKVDPGTEVINIHVPSAKGGDKELL